MSQELALSHYSRQWLGQVAANAKITPTRSGQRWLLHLTPDSPHPHSHPAGPLVWRAVATAHHQQCR